MENKKGSLVIEASIALTTFMFLILFFISFARIYRAQSVISHACFQTSQTMAVESFTREKVGEAGTLGAITKLADFIASLGGNSSSGATNSYRSYGEVSNLTSVIKKEFAYSIAASEEEADAKLKKLGVKDGLNGINFSESSIKSSDIMISVKYTLKLQFAFFGKSELRMEKKSCSKAFASIAEDNGYNESTTGSEDSTGSGAETPGSADPAGGAGAPGSAGGGTR